VSRQILIGTFYPEDLNLNGDQANLLILSKRLQWRGVSSEIVSVTGSSDLTAFDVLFLGHGSIAAWKSITSEDPKLMTNLVSYLRTGKMVIAIASGYLKILEALGEGYGVGEHRSEFVEVDGVVGYVNSSAEVPLLQQTNGSLFTMLHGPLFAKNPELVDELISQQGWVDVKTRNAELDKVDELAEASRKTAFEH